MDNIVIMKNKQAVTTSLNVAEDFFKRHDHVLRDVEKLKEDLPNFGEMFFEDNLPDSYNRDRKIYYMNRKGFSLLAMGYTGKKAMKFKNDYIDAFDFMEEEIIKNNQFNVSKDPWVTLKLIFEASEQTKDEVDEVKTRVINLEENVSIDPGKYNYIGRRISQKIRQVGKERKWTMNKVQLALLYKDLNKAVAEVSGVRTRAQLREKHFDNVMELIDGWEPSTATRMIVHSLEDSGIFINE